MLPKPTLTKKALITGAFFILACITLSLPAVGRPESCPADHLDAQAIVKSVHDGDTLTLKDGRKIRFAGINTPELAREGRPAQAYGPEAARALQALLPPGTRIGLRYDVERLDKYKRTLAHVYLHDGSSVQAWLLARGYAMASAVPPNLWNQNCYDDLEDHASARRRGLWALADYQPQASATLSPQARGFHVIRGKLITVTPQGTALTLVLEGDVTLMIAAEDRAYFSPAWLSALPGHTLEVKGWLYEHHQGLAMRLRHPTMLEVLDP